MSLYQRGRGLNFPLLLSKSDSRQESSFVVSAHPPLPSCSLPHTTSYLPMTAQRLYIHRQLAAYFTTLDAIQRQSEELPYHLEQSGDTLGLQRFLVRWDVFEHMFRSDLQRQELAAYWRQACPDQAASLYCVGIERQLLSASGHSGTALGVRRGTTVDSDLLYARIAARGKKTTSSPKPSTEVVPPPPRSQLGLAMAVCRVAYALHEWARFNDAAEYYQWALHIAVYGAVPKRQTHSDINNLLRQPLSTEATEWAAPIETAREPVMEKRSRAGNSPARPIPDLLEATPLMFRGGNLEVRNTTSQALVVATVLEAFARLRSHQAKRDQAQVLLTRTLDILLSAPGASVLDRSRVLSEMGWILITTKKLRGPAGAIAVLMQAIVNKTDALRAHYRLETPEVKDMTQLDTPWRSLLQAVVTAARDPSVSAVLVDRSLPAAVNRLAVAYTQVRVATEAAELVFETSLSLHRALFGQLHPATATVLDDIGTMLSRALQRKQTKAHKADRAAATAAATTLTIPAPGGGASDEGGDVEYDEQNGALEAAGPVSRQLSEPAVRSSSSSHSTDASRLPRAVSLQPKTAETTLFERAKALYNEAFVSLGRGDVDAYRWIPGLCTLFPHPL